MKPIVLSVGLALSLLGCTLIVGKTELKDAPTKQMNDAGGNANDDAGGGGPDTDLGDSSIDASADGGAPDAGGNPPDGGLAGCPNRFGTALFGSGCFN